MSELAGKRVLVLGGTGFIGSHVVPLLQSGGAEVRVHKGRSSLFDFTCSNRASSYFMPLRHPGGTNYDYVINLTGMTSNLQLNSEQPCDLFVQNTLMAINILEECAKAGVGKVISAVASCAYPAEDYDWQGFGLGSMKVPREECPETDFLDGPPHPSVIGHAYGKRNLQIASALYKRQYGLNAVCVCPPTVYGPQDSFDPAKTKVVGGMVKRFVDANKQEKDKVECRGSGAPLREVAYVSDVAKLIVDAMLKYDDSELPLNIGTGQEISIRELAELVAKLVGYPGEITWGDKKDDGQYRKRLDLSRMNQLLTKIEPTPLEVGLQATIDYYRSLMATR